MDALLAIESESAKQLNIDGLLDKFENTKAQAAKLDQGRRHGVDWGGHVHPTFARDHS